jgi:hypothetical protein
VGAEREGERRRWREEGFKEGAERKGSGRDQRGVIEGIERKG